MLLLVRFTIEMQIPHRFHKQPKLFYFAAKEVHFKILTHSFATHQMMCIFANHKHITNMKMKLMEGGK